MAEKGTNYSLEHFELVTFPFGLQLQNYGWGGQGCAKGRGSTITKSARTRNGNAMGEKVTFHAWVSDTNTNKQRALDPIFIGGNEWGETGGSHSKFPHFFITIYENYGGQRATLFEHPF